ncbi:MAG: ribosomal-processing cysteine protease Prp [Solobacterium sp.]|nr:ribosomal-processing cysteine protease Prp [Solobacterium sp.]
MIQAVLTVQNGLIKTARISGHSGSADKGEDLICAAVSAIVFGTCNALDELGSEADIEVSSNLVKITGRDDPLTQTILNTMDVQLRTVQEGRETFVNIRKTEV